MLRQDFPRCGGSTLGVHPRSVYSASRAADLNQFFLDVLEDESASVTFISHTPAEFRVLAPPQRLVESTDRFKNVTMDGKSA